MNNENKSHIKMGLPEMLAAVCDHPDCPEWLRAVIWDGFNDRQNGNGLNMTANYFRYAFEQVQDVENCQWCNQPIFSHSLAWHNACRKMEKEGKQNECSD